MSSKTILAASLSLVACATPDVPASHATAAQEAATAASEEQAAALHARQYRGSATHPTKCEPHGDQEICWSSTQNPTAWHLKMAARLRKEAAYHRSISKALVRAEASKCGGLSDADRDESPFGHVEDLVSASPRYDNSKLTGVTLVFRYVPGMTVESLQRVVDCHLARAEALGHDEPDVPNCPLLPGVHAKVAAVPSGFAVDLTTEKDGEADELVRRATALLAKPPLAGRE